MNTKHPLYKEKLKVEEQLRELYEIQRNQNWVELAVPYKDGYYKYTDLRDDIKNRADAWVFRECLNLVGGRIWSRSRSFKKKVKKGKYEYLVPSFGEISEEQYRNTHPKVQKYFEPVGPYSQRWNPYRKYYVCIVPGYYFIDKIKPRWITHYKEHDNLIEAQIAELDDYLDSKKFWNVHLWRGHGGVPREFTKSYTRSDRRHSKVTVKKNVAKGDDCDSYEYRYAHRHSARWDYW
jgi:hypothetical protein